MRAHSILTLILLLAGTQAFAADKPAAPRALSLKVANTGRQTIHAVYVAPLRASSWGQNLLGSRTVKGGEQTDVTVAAGCGTYDVRMVAEDGIEYLDDEVALCDDQDLLIVGEADLTKASARTHVGAAPSKQ